MSPLKSGLFRGPRLLAVPGVGLLLLLSYVIYLDGVIREKFEGRRWELPARVYARPLELYPGKQLTPGQLMQELAQLKYQPDSAARMPGSYSYRGDEIILHRRPFTFWDGSETAQRLEITVRDGQISSLLDPDSGEAPALVRLDPMLIASIYPSHHEDRILLRLGQVPQQLQDMLIAVEDRSFMRHHGLDWRGIARALWVNLKSGRIVQGGSTLTQQLVKNFYLSNERTLWRKANEAIMSLLLDGHYSKQEILEAYCNEIYLGQDGRRAIHGFALASEFYFQRPLEALSTTQYALLVGLVQGPSYYDPRRFPERARQRRNRVLEIAADHGILSQEQLVQAQATSLGVVRERPSGITPYPAFLDLVRRQLQRDYPLEALQSEGLRIFTTLDPLVQSAVERSVTQRLPQLEKQYRLPAARLEAAAIVTGLGNAEVVAVVGGREPGYAGFNRALDISRQIGSLVKPAVYLTALEQPQYTLATLLDDVPVAMEAEPGEQWNPQNFDHQSHGPTPLFLALAHSYNLATIHLGLQLGLTSIVDTLHRLGVEQEINAYPSLLLGTIELAPLEVAQLYQTLGDGGFHTPLRAIRAVLTHDNTLLQRYPLETAQRFAPEAVYLLNAALQQALMQGTGQQEYRRSLQGMLLAGKTGTTNDLRDSWYAGFGGDYQATVWLGTDDNLPTGLTGATGALRIWGEVMAAIEKNGMMAVPPVVLETVAIDQISGLRANERCPEATTLPFIRGSAPQQGAPCSGEAGKGPLKWLKGLVE